MSSRTVERRVGRTGLGLGLYTLRELDASLPEVIHAAAAAGYEGVEFVHRIHPEFDVEAVRAALEETGIEPLGVHVWLHQLEDDPTPLIERYAAVGCETFVVPFHSPTNVRREREVSAFVDRVNRVAATLDAAGARFLYHPHHWDLVPMFDGPVLGRLPALPVTDVQRGPTRGQTSTDGATGLLQRVENAMLEVQNRALDLAFIRSGVLSDNGLRTMLERTPFGRIIEGVDPELVGFEIDVSFFVQQGYAPEAVIELLGERARYVHAKDVRPETYALGHWPTFVDAEEGVLDFEAVADAAREAGVEWVIFEHGHTPTPVESIRTGNRVLRSVGLPS